jgi:hypothetical protein
VEAILTVFRYKDRGLPVTPIRPGKEGEVDGLEIVSEPVRLVDHHRMTALLVLPPGSSLSSWADDL